MGLITTFFICSSKADLCHFRLSEQLAIYTACYSLLLSSKVFLYFSLLRISWELCHLGIVTLAGFERCPGDCFLACCLLLARGSCAFFHSSLGLDLSFVFYVVLFKTVSCGLGAFTVQPRLWNFWSSYLDLWVMGLQFTHLETELPGETLVISAWCLNQWQELGYGVFNVTLSWKTTVGTDLTGSQCFFSPLGLSVRWWCRTS